MEYKPKATNGELMFYVVVLVLMTAVNFWYASAKCNAKSVSFEDRKWTPIQGCMVKEKGRWLPLENIRGFDGRD